MAPGRSSKILVTRRRRTKGDEEDDDSVTMADDTQSEPSIASDLDEDGDGDADASDLSDTDTTEPMLHDVSAAPPNPDDKSATAPSKRRRKAKKGQEQAKVENGSVFAKSADTEVMLNGFKDDAREAPAIAFDDSAVQDTDTSAAISPEAQAGAGRGPASIADRRRREHEEYKKKRDSDPTFIPNRGGFFMHDARIPEQRGFSSYARGRGRGRGVAGAPFPHNTLVAQPESAADANWKHDLHETVNQPNNLSKPSNPAHNGVALSEAGRGGHSGASRLLNFSKTTQIGKVQIRVVLPGAQDPILFSDVPVKSHARLPDHRPPLRRDKPVRISLPDTPPRYRFPSSDRSFIFIPRAMRPNQQGYGRARGSFGAYPGPASRRTSIYGGSVYSPSVSMSRRSSLAREIPRDSAFSPTGSLGGRPPPQQGRPVVRLPQRSSNASPAASVTAYGRGQPYPLPQKPAVEHWAEPTTMYQPRPQKTISVTGIESPAGMSLHAPQQQDQLPFQNQLPQHMAENGSHPQHTLADSSHQQYYSQPYMYPGGATTGTPLSNIPERAIHAQPFQPIPPLYPQYPAQGYYYAGPGPQYPAAPIYPQAVAPGYEVSDGAASHGSIAAPDPSQSQQGMVAYETNGMVYYQEATPMPQYSQQDGYYQAPAYGMGGMLTPGPEGNYYYPGGPMYYPQA